MAEAIDGVWSWRRSVVDGIVQRAKAHGEIRHDVAGRDVHELLDGPILLRVLVTREPLDMLFTDRLVDDVMAVVR